MPEPETGRNTVRNTGRNTVRNTVRNTGRNTGRNYITRKKCCDSTPIKKQARQQRNCDQEVKALP